jgi:condensin-2 complex subunit H2
MEGIEEESFGERYAELLRPIRDLAQNWNIDVASELEDYMDELEDIKISFDEGETELNFAEGERAHLYYQ